MQAAAGLVQIQFHSLIGTVNPLRISSMVSSVPLGLVAFLFTDIEGNTRLGQAFPGAMRKAMERHDGLLCAAVEGQCGKVYKTVGDGAQAAFAAGWASPAVTAALEAQRAFLAEDWTALGLPGPLRVRMALHVAAVA